MRNFSDEELISMVNENINHARHVETERITFISFMSAFVGAAIAVATELTDKKMALLLVFGVRMAQYLCTELTRRWNAVFKAHWDTAQKLAYKIQESTEDKPIDLHTITEKDIKNYEGINDLFCFNNSKNKRRSKLYIRTANLFNYFNYALLTLVIFMFFHIAFGG